MKKILFILCTFLLLPINIQAKEFEVTADYIILYNLDEDEILFEQNSHTKTSIASLTKIMTAIVAIENIEDLNQKVTITYEEYKGMEDYAMAGFNIGKQVSYLDILYGVLLPSGAEAANMLNIALSNKERSFIDLMNQKAIELNLENTKFDNPVGKDSINNYSCAKDVATLLKYALKNDTFRQIFTSLTHKVNDLDLTLKSTLINYATNYGFNTDYILGAKSGYTYDAGYCLASIANINDVNYLLVVIKSDTNKRYNAVKDSLTIYDYYSSHYSVQEIVNENDIMVTLPTKYGKVKEVSIKANITMKDYLPNEFNKENVLYKYQGIEELTYKIKQNDVLGTISIIYEDDVLATFDIKLDQEVEYYYPLLYISISSILVLAIFIVIKIKKGL